mmetsp:Transcript_41833/g.75959  ORF Transcript_41833/g.75959 Transcript_41833/m.75959 type:complete len:227 (-) Transcript_41833:60-740(-)
MVAVEPANDSHRREVAVEAHLEGWAAAGLPHHLEEAEVAHRPEARAPDFHFRLGFHPWGSASLTLCRETAVFASWPPVYLPSASAHGSSLPWQGALLSPASASFDLLSASGKQPNSLASCPQSLGSCLSRGSSPFGHPGAFDETTSALQDSLSIQSCSRRSSNPNCHSRRRPSGHDLSSCSCAWSSSCRGELEFCVCHRACWIGGPSAEGVSFIPMATRRALCKAR